METIHNFLNNYEGNSNFLNSVRSQYLRKGFLSTKQVAAVQNIIDKQDEPKNYFTYKVGEKITIGRWIAQQLAKDYGMDFFFRNLVITEIVRESYKAVQVKIRFLSEVATSCHICGKGLDTDISRATGIGPVCASKLGLKRANKDEASEILKTVEEFVNRTGEVGPVWIPKSQIKERR